MCLPYSFLTAEAVPAVDPASAAALSASTEDANRVAARPISVPAMSPGRPVG
jgi:hypothetical protein